MTMKIDEAIEVLEANYPTPNYTDLCKAVDLAISSLKKQKDNKWIPCSERMPEEHEWLGTKEFGTTISDIVNITFDVNGKRFVKVMSLQNGELSDSDKKAMDIFHKGWKMLAWMPLPESYKEGADDGEMA